MPEMSVEQAYQLAVQEHRAGRDAQALSICWQILAALPESVPVLALSAQLAHKTGNPEESAQLLRRLIALQPSVAEHHSNLGVVLATRGQFDEAITAFRQALALSPDRPEVHFHLALVLHEGGQSDESLQHYERTLSLNPGHIEARWNLGLELLLRGDFARGWPMHEQAGQMKDSWEDSHFSRPRWDGSDLAGRRIMLHSNQGMGDAIQFFRYVPMVVARGGQVILRSYEPLRRLLASQPGVSEFVSREKLDYGAPRTASPPQDLPEYDVQCPLMSLVRIFGTTLESISNQVPYVAPDPALVEQWQKRLDSQPPGLKVGLVWAGNPNPPSNRKRSMALADMSPLASVPGVRFYSLQKGEASQQARHPPTGMELIDWTDELTDFADTAALIANLDLVVSIDTSVAHLAGALGKPTWVALPYAADWRWLLRRTDCPWYPTTRLFRQPRIGDWPAVLSQIAEALRTERR